MGMCVNLIPVVGLRDTAFEGHSLGPASTTEADPTIHTTPPIYLIPYVQAPTRLHQALP